MSTSSRIVIESFRLQPFQGTPLPEMYSALLESLAQDTPTPEMYSALLERVEREDKLAREDARRRTHARVRELAKQQGVKPIRSIKELQGDCWPEEESIDDFLSWLRATRQEDKGQDIAE